GFGDWKLNKNISVASYTATAGTREGSGNLTITSDSSLTTLDLRGPGATTVAATVTTSVLDGGQDTTGGILNLNHDTAIGASGYGVGPTATLNIGATLSFTGDQSIADTGAPPGMFGEINVLGSGKLQKTGGSGISF